MVGYNVVIFLFQFLLIFRKAHAGELEAGSGLMDLFENMTEIDVDKEGVKGAKNFFQAKVSLKTKRKVFPVCNFREDMLSCPII